MRRIKTLAVIGITMALAIAPASAQQAQGSRCAFDFQRWLSQTLGDAQRIVLAIDNSWDRHDRPLRIEKLPIEKQCAVAIVQTLAGREFAILSFSEAVTVVQGPTTNTTALLNAINSIQSAGTFKNNVAAAIEAACLLVQPISPRGALVLLTAGLPTEPQPDPLEAARSAAESFKATCSPVLAVIDAGVEECFLRGLASSEAYFRGTTIITDTFTTVTIRDSSGKEWRLHAPVSNGILVHSQTPWIIQEARWIIKDNKPFGDPISELGGQAVRSSIEIGFLNRFGKVRLDNQEITLTVPKTSEGFMGLEIRAQQEWLIQTAFWTTKSYKCDEMRFLKDTPVQSIRIMNPRF